MTIEKGRFISIHGIDGTGKDTAAISVSEKLTQHGLPVINYDVYKDHLENPHKEKKDAADKSEDLENRLAVYLESMMYHSDNIKKLLDEGYYVVKSRYVDDIRAHFGHLGISPERVEEINKLFPMVQPDLKVVLVVDEDERQRRVLGRKNPTPQDLEPKVEGSRIKYFEDVLIDAVEASPPESALFVNTGNFDPSEVAEKIVNHLLAKQHVRRKRI